MKWIIATYTAVLGMLVGGLIAWHYLYDAAMIRAQATVDAEMSAACTCWFTDARCKNKTPTVICTKPEWMK